MAIFHCSVNPVSRSTGRSAPAAAAYRAGDVLENHRDGRVHDYSKRHGVEHAEIMLPAKAQNAEWARDRQALWNAAELAEKRSDSRVAREVVIALPHELNQAQRLELTRAFSQDLADRYGVAVDFAIHLPSERGDERNIHAHILMTTREVDAEGLGNKSRFEWDDKRLRAAGLPSGRAQVIEVRRQWEGFANEHLKQSGFDIQIDHRSHADRGLEIEPTQHVGVQATAMERDGTQIVRERMQAEAAQRNAERILERPEIALEMVTAQQSVFDHRDVARVVDRAVPTERFQEVYAAVMASPELVKLADEHQREDGRKVAAQYSTRELVEIEASMARHADSMRLAGFHGVSHADVQKAVRRSQVPLEAEQIKAVEHVTGREQISAVVGLAGAGKSTMLYTAREAWEAGGYRVRGGALAGKAAEGLEEASGIESRTLASWQRAWDRGEEKLGARDVLVIDEAGMVSSPQLERFIREADEAGAKIVLVGDPEQLQPIGPGAAFRAVVERTDYAQLVGVRRQREDWQREASRQFGQNRTAAALDAYAKHGHISMHQDSASVRAAIVADYMRDVDVRPDGSRLILAHRNVDVQALNQAVRSARVERGELDGGQEFSTSEGRREFAAGDRLLFRENNRSLGVKNGMLGTIDRVDGDQITVRLDGHQGPGRGRSVAVDTRQYAALDHGYAATIHKAQGATVDQVYVQGSRTMDRHLTYVAMTRHRDDVRLYAAADEFRSKGEIEAGKALGADEAQRRMVGGMTRSQAKETTLDYRDAYAGRRGFDPIVVPQDIAHQVERQVLADQAQQPEREVDQVQPSHDEPEAQAEPVRERSRAEVLAEEMRGMSNDQLLMERMRSRPRMDYERERFVADDPEVQRLGAGHRLAQERDQLRGQREQAAQRLQGLDGAGWIGKLGHGKEREQLRGVLTRLDRQINERGDGLQALGLDRAADAGEVGRQLRGAQGLAVDRLARDEAQRPMRNEAARVEMQRREAERGGLGRSLEKTREHEHDRGGMEL